MLHRDADILGALALAAVAVLVVLWGVPSGLPRTLATLPLAMVLPGYVLGLALFPERRSLDGLERAAVTIGLNLAVAILGGIVLHLTPWGLQAGSWALWLGAVTWGGSLAALARRQHLPSDQLPAIRWPTVDYRVLAPALLLVAAALTIAIAGSSAPGGEPFTQLWLLPDTLEGAPAVRLGLRNMETTATEYHLVPLADGTVVHEWPNLALAPGEAAETVIAYPRMGAVDELRAELYRTHEPTIVYRRAHLRAPAIGRR